LKEFERVKPMVKETNQRWSGRCFNYAEYGHWARECNKPLKKINKIKGKEIKVIANSIHGEGNEGNMLKESTYMFEMVAIEVDESKSWYFDS
jgi:hypothetical protein